MIHGWHVFFQRRYKVDEISDDMRQVDLVTTYLELCDPSHLRPATRTSLELREARIACPQLNRFLYTAVGGAWYWIDRLAWDYNRWLAYLSQDTVHTWVGYVEGTPAGYFELQLQEDKNVEIRSFGLLPQFIGKGFGGDLLTRSVEQCWSLGARRVWLHTCSLDSPRGLANYLARGFRVFRTERSHAWIPTVPPGPWPGSAADTTSI